MALSLRGCPPSSDGCEFDRDTGSFRLHADSGNECFTLSALGHWSACPVCLAQAKVPTVSIPGVYGGGDFPLCAPRKRLLPVSSLSNDVRSRRDGFGKIPAFARNTWMAGATVVSVILAPITLPLSSPIVD